MLDLKIDLKPKAKKFIESLPQKHQRQIKSSIFCLKNNPIPQDAKKLLGYEKYTRVDVGEYQIIYQYDSQLSLVTVVLVGSRNDDSVYKIAKRILK